ncbi:hypothetical protein EV144_1011184 [Flavobacterium sp. 270]|uniref:hypothetical protein n=1 Tax=Flavobacterium sp. 270 TaxID=2512114 RepID=UPI0010667DC1|nr:hypothetical protein [Flavobacterium sp. 270]TDW52494.1 hypothetical protein EV144_1011184 [Flavobacterium sp. 270]
MNNIGDFLNNSKGLTKNPLGIIALFVSLIYGFACLVLSSSIANLITPEERLPLIWFIILFPVIILLAFVLLVIFHHTKLYAPSDFRGDDSFIKVLDNKSIYEKQLDEVITLETAPIKEEIIDLEDNLNEQNESIEPITPDLELPKIVESQNENNLMIKDDLVKIHKNAESWAVQELSLKYNIVFQSNISVSTAYGKLQLDAMGKNKETVYILEIKYWETNKSDKKLKLSIQDFLLQSEKLEKLFKTNLNLKLVVVLVFDSLRNVNGAQFTTFVKSIYNDAHVEFFEYSKLKKDYE